MKTSIKNSKGVLKPVYIYLIGLRRKINFFLSTDEKIHFHCNICGWRGYPRLRPLLAAKHRLAQAADQPLDLEI